MPKKLTGSMVEYLKVWLDLSKPNLPVIHLCEGGYLEPGAKLPMMYTRW